MGKSSERYEYEKTEEFRIKHRAYEKEFRRRFPEKTLYRSCRKRAKRQGIEFSIEETDIVIPDFCPVLLQPLEYCGEDRRYWPSVDRVDNSKGYIKGNVRVISYKANMMKSDFTIEQVKNLLKLMEEHHE